MNAKGLNLRTSFCGARLALALGIAGLSMHGHAVGREVSVTQIDGVTREGQVEGLAPALVLKLEDGQDLAVPWTNVLAVTQRSDGAGEVGSPPAQTSSGALSFEFSDQSLFFAELESVSNGQLFARVADKGVRFELSAIRVIRALAPPAAAERVITAELKEAAPPQDVVVVARDARVVTLRGAVVAIAPDGLTVRWNDRDVRLPWQVVCAVRFAAPLPRSATCLVRLRDGQAFGGRVTGGDADRLQLHSGVIGPIELSWNDIVRIDCRSERVILLADIEPGLYEHDPLLGRRWPLGVNRSLLGGPLAIGSQSYASGLCLRSRSSLRYTLGGRFKQFAAQIGISADMAPRGNAAVTVLGDGQVLWREREVRGGQPPLDVLVEVEGVNELTLLVEPGSDLDLSDHVVFGLARLIK